MGSLNASSGLSRRKHIDYTEFDSFADAVEQIKHWLEVEYMTERIHSSLAYLTPFEFEAAQVIRKWESPILTP